MKKIRPLALMSIVAGVVSVLLFVASLSFYLQIGSLKEDLESAKPKAVPGLTHQIKGTKEKLEDYIFVATIAGATAIALCITCIRDRMDSSGNIASPDLESTS